MGSARNIGYKVSILGLKEFAEIREAWNALVLRMEYPSIFCSWEWIYTWWEHYGETYDPVILTINEGLELKGIFPLALRKSDSVKDALRGQSLSYCGSNELYPDHIDIICNRDDAKQCINAVIDFLSSEYKDWDVLNVALVGEGSNLKTYLGGHALRFETEMLSRSTAPFISLSGTFDEYIKRFTSKKKYNIRSSQKKLLKQFGIRYTSYAQEGIDNGLETLFRLHALRAEMKQIKSTFNTPDIEKFHRALAERISGNGWLCLRSLSNDTETIASMYSFVFGGRLFYYQIGFNPEWERYSPGTVLIYQVLEEAFALNYKEFDFLRGGEDYKSSWTGESRQLFSISVYNKSFKASFTKALSKSKRVIKNKIKRFAD